MKAIIVGCGRLGTELSERLFKNGHEVVVIDLSEEAFKNLPGDFKGRPLQGDALNLDVLTRAGIEEADALACVTNNDALNMVICYIAQETYHIPRVIARNYDPFSRSLFEDFGVQVVGSASWGAQRIEELLYHEDMRTVFSAGNGEVEIYEIIIPAACEGQRLGELMTTANCVAVSISRAGRARLPQADFALEAGDVLHVSATFEGISVLRDKICGFGKEG